jgi:hypothetical protein
MADGFLGTSTTLTEGLALIESAAADDTTQRRAVVVVNEWMEALLMHGSEAEEALFHLHAIRPFIVERNAQRIAGRMYSLETRLRSLESTT